MTDEDLGEFLKHLDMLAEVFETDLSASKQVIYFNVLKDLDADRVEQALLTALRTCTFFPKPAELRKLVLGDDDDVAERAWLSLKRAMRGIGSYSSLIVQDAALGESILSVFGSWSEACALDLSPEMWSSKRKEFGRVYRVYRDRNLTGARRLRGFHEKQNGGVATWARYIPVQVLEIDGSIRPATQEELQAYVKQLTGAEPEETPLARLPTRMPDTLRRGLRLRAMPDSHSSSASVSPSASPSPSAGGE